VNTFSNFGNEPPGWSLEIELEKNRERKTPEEGMGRQYANGRIKKNEGKRLVRGNVAKFQKAKELTEANKW